MAINYRQRWRSSGAGCLMSAVCSQCYVDGERISFFGVAPNGRTILGTRLQDRLFQREVWQACLAHYQQVHHINIVSNVHGKWIQQPITKDS